MTITDEQLEEWELLCEGATPGPWEALYDTADCQGPADIRSEHDGEIVAGWNESIHRAVDAEFITAARTALPALIAELRWLRYRYATYRAAVEERERRRRPWTGREVVEHAERSGLSQESVDNILGARAMHPHGRCECCGEGRCEWCKREDDL